VAGLDEHRFSVGGNALGLVVLVERDRRVVPVWQELQAEESGVGEMPGEMPHELRLEIDLVRVAETADGKCHPERSEGSAFHATGTADPSLRS
jgi:hypothetical protein